MRKLLLFLALIMNMCASAQGSYRDISKRLNMVNIWDQHALSEISDGDRMNKVAYTDSGIVGLYTMDLSGYLLCLTHFENAAKAADYAYGSAKIILVDAALPPDGSQIPDVVYMDRAYREGMARMHIIREYHLSGTQKLSLVFVCNDTQRYFEVSTKGIQ